MLGGAPGLAQSDDGQASRFELPERADTRTPTSQPQGPVDQDGEVILRPRVIAPPRPVPTTAAPIPAPPQRPAPVAPRPTIQLPEPVPSPVPRDPAASPVTSVPRLDEAAPAPLPERPTFTGEPVPEAEQPVPAAVLPSQGPVSNGDVETVEANVDTDAAWPIPLALIVMILLAGGVAWWWRRRSRTTAAPVRRPTKHTQKRPKRAMVTDAGPATLTLDARPIKLTRSVMNAVLEVEIAVTNNGPGAIQDLQVGAEMVSAHNSLALEEQLAEQDRPIRAVQTIARITPGSSRAITAAVRLPVSALAPIRQGKGHVFVPLLQLKCWGHTVPAQVRNFVVGQPNPGSSRLQPFRLDEPPRSYQPLGARALD